VLYEMLSLQPPFRAEDMEGLYRKVLSGKYPRIPKQYSADLNEVLDMLLQVNPRQRPSIDQLLAAPVMMRHNAQGARPAEDVHATRSDLLQTIKLPKNAKGLSACLPEPRYDAPEERTRSHSLGRAEPQREPAQPLAAANAAPDSLDAYLHRQKAPSPGGLPPRPVNDHQEAAAGSRQHPPRYPRDAPGPGRHRSYSPTPEQARRDQYRSESTRASPVPTVRRPTGAHAGHGLPRPLQQRRPGAMAQYARRQLGLASPAAVPTDCQRRHCKPGVAAMAA